ncbi:MAG TPA: NADH-quinone oxidoreductase subunit NuoN [Actinomycetota bacterium]
MSVPIQATPEIVWRSIGPVLVLAGAAALTLLWGAFARRIRRERFAILTLAALGGAGFLTFDLARADREIVGMQGMVAVDGVALFTNLVLLLAAGLTVLASFDYLSARRIHRFEFYPLLLLATAGMVLLASAANLILLFIALEVLSLSLYVLVGLARADGGAQEASMKYFLLGAFSSAILLYGIALAYGATGETSISAIADAVAGGTADLDLLWPAVALVAVGFAFKVGAVPFHMWTPDVYQGAPTTVTGFMAAATKAAAFAALLRVFLVSFGSLQFDWRPALWLIAIVTMLLGSVVAIVQTDVKRLLAYSSIAHAGFVLIGVVAADRQGLAGSLFYLLVYALMTIGAFALVAATFARGSERLDVGAWAGLGRGSPVVAGAMTLFLVSMAGLPPTAGFMAKFFVFKAAVEAGETWLVLAGVAASVIAAFFYLRLIVAMWMQEPEPSMEPVTVGMPAGVALAVTGLATLALGVYPQALMDLARTAAVFTG